MIALPNRMRVVVVMVSALALAAGMLTLALLEKPAQAQAQTITDEYWSTFTDTFTGCNGELVQVQITSHTVAHSTIDENGVLHTQYHVNNQGQGTSDSGAKYTFHDVYNFNENNLNGTPYNGTITESGTFIRQGSATPTDDLQVNLLLHVTANAQGEVTVVIENIEAVCR